MNHQQPPTNDASDLPIRLGSLTRGFLLLATLPPLAVLGVALTRAGCAVSLAQTVAFYIVPVALISALLWLAYSTPTARLSASLLLITVGVMLLGSELLMHAFFAIQATNRIPVSGPTVAEALQSLRSQGADAFPTVPGNVLVDEDATLFVADAILHPITPAPGGAKVVLCNETGTLVTYDADRFGFNNPDTVWDREQTDVALIGDSYIHGVCVPGPEQPGALIARQHSTLNVGAAGFGPLLQLAVLREFIAPMRPKTVVWVYYEGNDRYDLNREVERSWLTAYLNDPAHTQSIMQRDHAYEYRVWINDLIEVTSETTAPPAALIPSLSELVSLSSWRHITGFGIIFPSRQSAIEPLPDVLEAGHMTASTWGANLVFVYVPAFERYRVVIGEGVPGRSEVLSAAKAAGYKTIDLSGIFEETRRAKEMWNTSRAHLSAEGYRLMTNKILEAIER